MTDTNEVKIQVISTLTCSLASIKKRSGEVVPFDVPGRIAESRERKIHR